MKNKSKKNNRISKSRKGLTFIEVITVVFIFSLIILATMGIAGAYLKNRITIKKYQQNLEEMSLAINEMAKKIRMSNCDTGGGCNFIEGNNIEIMVTQNSGSSLTYSFKNNGGEYYLERNGDGIMKDIEGRFYVVNSGSDGIPRITITMWKHDMEQAVVQTTVSMRGGYNSNE